MSAHPLKSCLQTPSWDYVKQSQLLWKLIGLEWGHDPHEYATLLEFTEASVSYLQRKMRVMSFVYYNNGDMTMPVNVNQLNIAILFLFDGGKESSQNCPQVCSNKIID